MRQHEDPPRGLDGRLQTVCLGERAGQGLFADHVDAGGQEGRRGRGVDIGRRRDDDGVDPVRPLALPPGHLAEVVIDAVGRDQQTRRGRARDVGVDGEGARDQVVEAVGLKGDPMRLADDGIEATADHAEPQPAPERPDEVRHHACHEPFRPCSPPICRTATRFLRV